MQKLTLFDLIWFVLVGGYICAGMPITPFHGDETNFIWGSRDFTTAVLQRQPQTLMFDDPHTDGAGYLRIMQGSVVHFSIGLILNAAGMLTDGSLPPRGYNWSQSYESNVANGTRPSGEFLVMARFPSTFFLALSAIVMFALGDLFGGKPISYIVSGLYALNPAILLNGHRAMQEGALLLFGLLTILIAVSMVRIRDRHERVSWRWWLGLILGSALAVASKNTGVLYVISAFAWIFVAELVAGRWRSFLQTTLRLLISAILAIALYWAISPGMWHANPLERIHQLLVVREEQISGQVVGINHGPAPQMQRVGYLFFQPYMMPTQPFELSSWRNIEPIMSDVRRYDASLLSGIHFGAVAGGVLTLLAVIGLFICCLPRLRPEGCWGLYAGLLSWLGVNIVILLLNPLPWQRYYLTFIPIVILLTGIAIAGIARALYLLRQRPAF